MEYRILGVDDYQNYSNLRSEALATNPEAFGSTEIQEVDVRKPRYEAMQKSDFNFIVGAFDGEKLVGMVGYMRSTGPKVKHKGHVWGVYVNPAYRGRKVGSQLLKMTVDKAFGETDIELIQLGVSFGNNNALILYANAGFDVYGVEKQALFVNGEYIDEYLMVRYRNQPEEK